MRRRQANSRRPPVRLDRRPLRARCHPERSEGSPGIQRTGGSFVASLLRMTGGTGGSFAASLLRMTGAKQTSRGEIHGMFAALRPCLILKRFPGFLSKNRVRRGAFRRARNMVKEGNDARRAFCRKDGMILIGGSYYSSSMFATSSMALSSLKSAPSSFSLLVRTSRMAQ